MTTISALDLKLFYFLNSLIGRTPLLDRIIIFFARDYLFIIIAVVFIFLFYNYKDERKSFLRNITRIIVTLILVYLTRTSIRLIYHHARPFITLKTHHLFSVASNSFPSGHTIFIIGLAAAFYSSHRKLSYFLFISGLLVGFGRVAAGVHYPLDILGGIFFGVLMGIISYYLCRYIFRNTAQM